MNDRGRRTRRAISAEVYAGPQAPAPDVEAVRAEHAGVARATIVGDGRLSYDLDAGTDAVPSDLRRRREYHEAADLSSELLDELTGLVEGVHTAIADRVFRYVGPPARPVKAVHSAIAVGVYSAIRTGAAGVATLAGAAFARRPAPPLSTTRTGGIVLGAVNGVLGAELDERDSPLAVQMGLWADGRPVPPTRSQVAAAYPDATSRLVVFAHGLCETEVAWHLNAATHYGDASSTHGSRLRAELGYSPVYLRYNTGRHISDNGRQFSDLLQRLVDAWPVAVDEIVLVGHSMGGLLIRSACYEASTLR